MNQKKIWLGMLIMTLALGMMAIGCDNGTTGGNDNGEELPLSSGINAVSGKTYFQYSQKTVFSATADGVASGTYTVGRTVYDYDDENDEYYVLVDGKYTYSDNVIGTYSWNEGTKTLTLKPEKMVLYGTGASLEDKAGGRKKLQAYLDSYKKEVGEEAFNQEVNEQLSYYGLSSLADYINYFLNELFSNKTYSYSFSTDGTALFLEESLPANKGANELSGQTYYGMRGYKDDNPVKNENHTYVFTANGYTESEDDTTYTGSYAYDSSQKRVWLRRETIDGKNRAAYYAEQTVPSGHNYVDDNAYRAAETNDWFSYIEQLPYNNVNKTIGRED